MSDFEAIGVWGGAGGESKLVLLDNLRVKLGPKGAATAFSDRWWWKAAR